MPGSRATRCAGVGAMLLSVAGCYTYAPPVSAPAPGAEVAVVLTDRGRAALGERIGPEIDQLRGRLVSSNDTSVTVAMRESVTLRGVSAAWGDEQLTVSREQLATVRVKALSKGRTGVLAGTMGAVLGFFVINGGFDIGGRNVGSDPSTPPGGPGPSSRIGTLLIPFRSDF